MAVQLRRAAVSVPANIAEGHGRGGKDFLRFLRIAYGSLMEVETHIEIAQELGYLEKEETQQFLSQCDEIAKMLNGLKQSLSDSLGTIVREDQTDYPEPTTNN